MTERHQIRKNLDEYLQSLTAEERSAYLLANSTMLAIVHSSHDDEAILSSAKRHDEQNGTNILDAILQFRTSAKASDEK